MCLERGYIMKMKGLLSGLAVAMMCLPTSTVTYAGWEQEEENSWKYWSEEKGGYTTEAWQLIHGNWFLFNEQGKMLSGWQWADGYCYYLAEVGDVFYPMGTMYADRRTPDEFQVNKTGAWVDEKGNEQFVWGKGVRTKTDLIGVRRGAGGGGRSGGGGVSGGGDISNGGNTSVDDNPLGVENSKEDKNPFEHENHETDLPSQIATPSEALTIDWQIHFTDEETKQIKLSETRRGSSKEGEIIKLHYQSSIIDKEGVIWQVSDQAPLEITVYGPGEHIYYIEYIKTGVLPDEPDPYAEEKNRLEEYYQQAKEMESKITGEEVEHISNTRFCITNQSENNLRIQSIISHIDKNQSNTFYIIGKNFIPNGIAIPDWFGSDAEYSNHIEEICFIGADSYVVARMSVSWKEEEEILKPIPGKQHWNLGDIVEQELDGIYYQFQCIDQNYLYKEENQKQMALFLCTSIISADTGSDYWYVEQEDGSLSYEFCPGPIVNFGSSNDYKYSHIRKWLNETGAERLEGEEIPIGVDYAYTGYTEEMQFGEINRSGLKPGYIGNQKMSDRIFILSVDEALKYKEYLWKFEGEHEENPDTQYGPYSKGYWLRNPMGTSADYDTNYVYVVDIVNGNIRPWLMKPEEVHDDKEQSLTSTIGVRPAFVMPQES